MEGTYFYLAMIIGLTISLLSEEFFGISCGGMIVPGYLAMVCDNLTQIFMIFGASMVIWFVINHILPRLIILFGKRKFVATLIVGLIVKILLDLLFPGFALPFTAMEFRGVGAITPALIANCCAKQGFRYTIPAVLIAAYLTFGILTALCFVF